ncbi:MAG: glycoside hydrolase family 2 TIM barrel-domain containing protein [Gemmatales bacterium]
MARTLLGNIALLLLTTVVSAQEVTPRKTTSLNGEWTFHRDGSGETKTVTLPTHWETHEGLKFDGIGWYEKTIELPELPKGRRLLLHFDAVATHATVYWNDKELGEHLGAWTPFRFDVTDHMKKAGKHIIKVRVDEKVGHNTQGFLPIIAPHFGGIWQGVRLIEVPETYIDDLRIGIQSQRITIPVIGKQSNLYSFITASWYNKSTDDSGAYTFGNPTTRAVEDGVITIDQLPPFKIWTPSTPETFNFRIMISSGDVVIVKSGFRTIETKGDQFLLNGQPLSIRGVLNWGYYPPSLAPLPTEKQWREDIRLIKSWGFNLMKCCLWVPSKRLLEIADEEGILIWLEYPTWHPKLTPQYQAELMQEYKEFHQLDRNHPSVILRSLTCETGPSADIKVIQALYDQCKKMCGGLVVDDSSWIEWNRVFDFYDDHPYGNNHTWVATLDRLKKYIATSKYGVKPLCLGEAIAADTWVPTKPMLEAIAKAKADPKQAWSLDERGYPFWVPGFFDANRKWLERMGRVCGGPVDEESLYWDSLEYAWQMRKYQMQTFRKEVPNGGYVVSVLRDFPLASMGLINYLGEAKWPEKNNDWNWSWHREKKPSEKAWPAPLLLKSDYVSQSRIVSRLDPATIDFLEKGGRAILLSDGKPGSFPLRSHWFLRGGPFVNEHHPYVIEYCDGCKRALARYFAANQHFDLASDVIPDINYLEEIDPILMLWDNHDIKEVKTHGLVFETRVGKGRLLVSALNHKGDTNAAGKWLLQTFLKHLDSGPPPRNALKPETIARMRAKLNEKKIDLVTKSWQFMPDGKNEGLKLGWEKPGFDDKAWKPIKIGAHWEGQGYPALDGWAWYRLAVDVPPYPQPLSPHGKGEQWYLNTEGVDDAYEIYINGTKIGSGGDIPNKKTAFEDRTAHAIPAGLLKPGEKNVIAVRVYDWYGAGGIHRPMSLSTVPIGGVDILR